MKKAHSLLLSLFLSLGLITAASSQAAAITFDDLPATDVDAIPENYNGFIWGDSFFTNVSYIHKNTIPDSGYANGVVSGDYAALNLFATTSVINTSGGEQFDFNGAYLTAGSHDGLNIEVTGLLNNLVLFTQTITVNTQQAQWFDFNFLGINSLSLSAWGSPSGNDFFVLDNFTYNETNVPESSSLALLLLGLSGLLLSRKTQKA